MPNNYSTRALSQMSTVSIYNGDAMTQPEFHKLYSAMPDGFTAELIAGMVHVRPPTSLLHAEEDSLIRMLLKIYSIYTPGTQCAGNATVILSGQDEVQPDSFLRVDPEFGGQSSNWRRFVKGAPELVSEVSYTSRAIDLHKKKERYKQFGVKEYIVSCLEPRHVYWFDLHNDGELIVGRDGICRSQMFAGLWIDINALLLGHGKDALDSVMCGIDSAEHQQFSRDLQIRKG